MSPKFLSLDGGDHVAEIHKTQPRHCHKMVREVAQGICAAFYEQAAHDNVFRRQFPSQRSYVYDKWGAFVDAARAQMAKMLAGNYPETMKNVIYEALQYDAAARGGHFAPSAN